MSETEISGVDCLIKGVPEATLLRDAVTGPGDLWHSGLQRACSGLLYELVYYLQVYSYYLNDANASLRSVSWRVDPTGFVIRSSAWEAMDGFDAGYESDAGKTLDFGFRLLQNGGIPLHIPNLFDSTGRETSRRISLPREDVYLFFVRHFKTDYRWYMFLRESIKRRSLSELRALRRAEERAADVPAPRTSEIAPRPLRPLSRSLPLVSAIVPTLRRQPYTANLLRDYAAQTIPFHQVIVVDATPEAERDEAMYADAATKLPLQLVWQTSIGSCRARNEAIRLCTGDYILFADDDTRVPPTFVENHIRLLETYGADASVGIDVRADHHQQNLEDLEKKLAQRKVAERVGAAEFVNNANTCVRRAWVEQCVGNDVNFDGGYGEDADFGYSLIEKGAVILSNPYSADLHLKPPAGGYRWWGEQAKQRRKQPWEIKRQVGMINPKPSPTILYGFLKHYTSNQVREWLYVYLLRSWWPSYSKKDESQLKRALMLLPRVLMTPAKLIRIWVSYRFARDLMEIGPRFD